MRWRIVGRTTARPSSVVCGLSSVHYRQYRPGCKLRGCGTCPAAGCTIRRYHVHALWLASLLLAPPTEARTRTEVVPLHYIQAADLNRRMPQTVSNLPYQSL